MLWRRRQKTKIGAAEALAGQRAGELVLVDVREHSERARGDLRGSLHVPMAELRARLAELPSDRPLAFVCAHGIRSAVAARTARRAGLDARSVAGGMAALERQDRSSP